MFYLVLILILILILTIGLDILYICLQSILTLIPKITNCFKVIISASSPFHKYTTNHFIFKKELLPTISINRFVWGMKLFTLFLLGSEMSVQYRISWQLSFHCRLYNWSNPYDQQHPIKNHLTVERGNKHWQNAKEVVMD